MEREKDNRKFSVSGKRTIGDEVDYVHLKVRGLGEAADFSQFLESWGFTNITYGEVNSVERINYGSTVTISLDPSNPNEAEDSQL